MWMVSWSRTRKAISNAALCTTVRERCNTSKTPSPRCTAVWIIQANILAAVSKSKWGHEKPKPKKCDPLEPWAQEFQNKGSTSKIDSPRRIADSIFQANTLAVCTQPGSSNVQITRMSISAGSLDEPLSWNFTSWRSSLCTDDVYNILPIFTQYP
jgi:hypothetical protein